MLSKFYKTQLDTPLGDMVAIANEEFLFFLEFNDRKNLDKKIEKITLQPSDSLIHDRTQIHSSIENELKLYFEGTLEKFKTPFMFIGTSFQKIVWKELTKIPYGNTRSYMEQAKNIMLPKAYRAVANANGANKFAVMIPCHRIINTNGELGGYGGGIARKKWLLDHENLHKNNFH